MTPDQARPVALPALRARMGDWVYYVSAMKMRHIANRISIAEDIHPHRSLRQLLQRSLTGRSEDIKEYLLQQPQRFFNALVIATYGGSPKWNEVTVRDPPIPLHTSPDDIEGTLGILTLTGNEKLFAVDGQHRVAGIKAAIAQRPRLGNEEVGVIFIRGVNQENRDADPTGFERTRRVFSTLNRYAKPVAKTDIIALDEDDVVAIVTRRLLDEYPLFRGRNISSRSGNSLPPNDTRSFTTITAVYDALDAYLPDTRRGWNKFKRLRPSDADIESYYERSVTLWNTLLRHWQPLRLVGESEPDDQVAAQFRTAAGGHLLFRPIGLLLVIRATKRLMRQGLALDAAVARFSRIPTDLASEPWTGLLWDDTNRRMIPTPNKQAVEKLLLYLAGGETDEERLREELAGVLNRPLNEYSLPTPL